VNIPKVLWQPTTDESNMHKFARFVERSSECSFASYDELHAWSVDDIGNFWAKLAEFMQVSFVNQPTCPIENVAMPGTKWFPDSTLNYAEHALRVGPAKAEYDVALIFLREDGLEREITHGQLRDLVARARKGLVGLGVTKGDFVVALAPNCVETLVLFLATASLGAIWSSCSPDFGSKAIEDRFVQLNPKVLFTVDGYLYGGKQINILPTVIELQKKLPTLTTTVLLPYRDTGAQLPQSIDWSELTADHEPIEFVPVAFDHRLWVLFSSGTTGLPKGIVHGHGGILLEHLKLLGLHHDLQPGERFMWFTTTGWMMWNYLVSSLAVGAVPVLFDGNPGFPDLNELWRLAAKHEVGQLGASAPFIHACMKAGIEPGRDFDLSKLRTIGSTGAPLSPEGFSWVSEHVGSTVQIASVSGGTDVCTAFLGQSPMKPIWEGELSCAELGCEIAAVDESGNRVYDEVGELVILQPMPSMPVSFINDPDGTKMREAYFEMFPGIWRHGDWVRQTDRNSYVIYGRSDSTLNRGGVRMGTADFYSVVEGFAEVVDSLVVDTTALGAVEEGELLCFVVLQEAAELEPLVADLRAALRGALSPRHIPDRFIPIKSVPRTLSGKKCEVPVKKILAGANPESVVSRDALQDPNSLDFFIDFANN
jgi:acetoacetyl-CoA synthetase